MGLQKGALLGPYEIVALVGAGGMGEVYRARDERIGRDVAIKVLPPGFATDPERLRRFEQEARAAGALDHPNILTVHDVGSFEGSPYMVTEFLKGETLRQRMHGAGLTVHKAVEVAIQIARGLAAAHEKGIVHRDLKPANVFVTNDGHVKILDFGLAKVTHPGVKPDPYGTTATSASSTEAGGVMGTMGYMSPEQLRGQPADARSDIFAFGCVLYELVSGQPPFLKATAADTVTAVLTEDPPGLDSSGSTFPPGLRQIARRCLEKRPNDRFSSAHDLALALEAMATDTSGGRAIPDVTPRGTQVRILLATAAAVVVVLAAWGFWFVRNRGPTPLPKFSPRRVAGQLAAVSEPALSPSGSEVAYTAEGRGTSDIWVTDVRGGKPIRLTEGPARSSGPTWFPDGSEVAFSSDDGKSVSVWKVARFGGSAMLLVPNAQDAAVSPNGDQIAFARPQEDGALRIWVAPLGAPEMARKLTADGAGLWDHRRPGWSPDGRRICYQATRDLWLIPVAGGDVQRFTQDAETDSEPVWSPSGRFIYFVSERGGTRSLWRKAVAGGAPVRVTHGASVEESPSMSRDGRRIAFLSGLDTWAVALLDMRTGQVSQLGQARHTAYPAISPDGGSIVYASDIAGSWDLWSVALRGSTPSGEPVRLTDHPGECVAPRFSPDGRWIAYFRVIAGQRDIWVIPAQGGPPVNFTGHPGVNVEPAWSPDGREIAFISNRSGWHQVWAAPFADGHRAGEPRRITSEVGDASSPSYSPDGKAIAYVLTTQSNRDIWIAASNGSGVSRGLTAEAKVMMVRWLWARNTLVASGFWGERLPTIRLVPPWGGEATRLVLPSQLVPDLEYPLFDISSDETTLGLFQRARQGEIWVLEAEEGSF